MYPEKKKSAKKTHSYPSITLRNRLTPGRIVILLAGRQQYRGSRMVFLKQLESGHLLLAGPTSLNRTPLIPILQTYVIATSTLLPLNSDVTKYAARINFSMFKKEKKKKVKDSGIFSDSVPKVSNTSLQTQESRNCEDCKIFEECIHII